jgi:SpoVK/Ycf46/Vps4 family AAA+-type ATPase
MMVDIAQPRGEVAGLLTGGFSQERLRDVVLAESTRARLERIIQEHVHRADLEGWGVSASRKLLFCGPPGCGKTMTSSVIAGELGLPLMTVRFDGLFSRFLGATANHLKVIFDEMPRRPAVYFFDEFDAIAKSRGDAQDVGEVRRVVTSFLQLMDADRSSSIIIAATNFDELLDHAVFRRFDVILPFALPTVEQLTKLIHLRLRAFDLPKDVAAEAAGLGVGLSFADAARACDDAVRTMVLARRRDLLAADLRNAFILAAGRVR